MLFWWPLEADLFRAPFRRWGAYIRSYMARRQITDLVLFGDCRPYHRVAIAIARRQGIAVHVLEEGYLRPHWITLESDGANALSSFPRDATTIRELAAQLPVASPREEVSGGFAARAVWDIAYHLVTVGLGTAFPNYVKHRPYHPFHEAWGWIRRLLARHSLHRQQVADAENWLAPDGRVFLFPLQLDADYQVRRHSSMRSVSNAVRAVLTSFAAHAGSDDRLLIKIHPLDNGLVDHRSLVRSLASALGLGDRVMVLDGGDLAAFMQRCAGVIVINSTTGITAMHHRRPVAVLGNAIYDIEGLTHQGSIDSFWRAPTMPDPELFADFFKLLMARTQVNGSFFTRRGIELGVEGALRRLEAVQPKRAALPASRQLVVSLGQN